jgi:hypothetical protein
MLGFASKRANTLELLGPIIVQKLNRSYLLEGPMRDEHLTIDQCEEMAEALRQNAADLPDGSEKENLLKLAEGYRDLANMKRMVLRKVN